MCVSVRVYLPYGNCKSKNLLVTQTHTQERNPNITLEIVIKSQGTRAKEEKGTKKDPQKQTPQSEQNDSKHIPINNFSKCKSSKYSNENI